MGKVLELQNVTKVYPGVVALDGVSVSFDSGEVHAIMGENGAGKSTMIKVIAGAISCDGGKILIDEQEYTNMTPSLSKQHGIGVIYQEFNLVPGLNIAENIFLGDKVGGKYVADFKEMHKRSAEILEDLGVHLDTHLQVGQLSTAQQQLVEISKAMAKNVKVLIMDEPSAVLAVAEVENMLQIVDKLRKRGITIIYISHRMDEVFRISDRITIMRDGKYVATRKTGESNRRDLINLMVGRELSEDFPTRNVTPGEVVLELKHVYGNGDSDISLQLHKGEILGLAGLVGAGRTELAKVIYGAVPMTSGEIHLHGKKVTYNSPRQAIDLGIGLIPEDRKQEGAFLNFSIRWNIPVMTLPGISKFMVVDQKKASEIADEYTKRLRIKTPGLDQYVRNLSGGNQQKVVVAKTLAAHTEIIIFDEPTRGIDVGAKQEIYALMNELVEQGISIIMISSEMEELFGMSDRILVLYEGRITGEVQKDGFNQNTVLELASGLVQREETEKNG